MASIKSRLPQHAINHFLTNPKTKKPQRFVDLDEGSNFPKDSVVRFALCAELRPFVNMRSFEIRAFEKTADLH